jgi:arginine decarboxylase
MSGIRIVWGGGVGPTALSAYDAALADAGLHNYNLVTVTSVIPAGAPLEVVGTAPDLGPVGGRLAIVEGRGTVSPATADRDADAGDATAGRAAAALAWARDDEGRGLFYEADGTDSEHVREVAERGLRRGGKLREWSLGDRETVVRTTPARREAHACVVVCGVYGESSSLL